MDVDIRLIGAGDLPALRAHLRRHFAESGAGGGFYFMPFDPADETGPTGPAQEQLALPLTRGRIDTAPDMAVTGRPGVWAIGDCALVTNAADERPSPPTAQFAVAQAKQLAANIARPVTGQPTRPFAYTSRGMMATVGHMNGVAQVFGLRLSGLPAWLLWRAFYLLRMPTFGRKLHIWAEWTWGMFFSADITHLRFTRSGEAEDEPVAPQAAASPLASRP